MTVLPRPVATASPTPAMFRLLATVLAALLFTAGWTAGAVVQAVLWCVTAIRLGWDDARHRDGGTR